MSAGNTHLPDQLSCQDVDRWPVGDGHFFLTGLTISLTYHLTLPQSYKWQQNEIFVKTQMAEYNK